MKNLLTQLQLYFPKVTIRAEDDPLVETLLHRLELQEIPVEYQQVVIKELRGVLSELSVTNPVAPPPAEAETDTLTENPVDPETPPVEPPPAQVDLKDPEGAAPEAPAEAPEETVTLLETITQIVQQVQEHCAPSEQFAEYRATYLTTVLQTATQLIFGETPPNADHVTQCVTILQRTLQDMAVNLEQAEFAWVFTTEEIPTIVEIVQAGLSRLVQTASPSNDEPSATVT